MRLDANKVIGYSGGSGGCGKSKADPGGSSNLRCRRSYYDFRSGLLLLLLMLIWTDSIQAADNSSSTPAPTPAPTAAGSGHDHNHDNTTHAPSLSPTRLYPTIAPTPERKNHTAAPTTAAASNATFAPSSKPPPAPATETPTASPTSAPSSLPPPPTAAPTKQEEPVTTTAPSAAPTAPAAPSKKKRKHMFWRILGKTLGWLILIALSVLLFGAIMSNRYQIYYTIVTTLRFIRHMECTRWILQVTRLSRFFGDDDGGAGGGSLNEVIFDRGDLTEGLLMTGEDQS